LTTGAEQRAGVAAERLHWAIGVNGGPHEIDLAPAAIGGTVRIVVDGLVAGRIAKPTPQRPWREASLAVDGEPVQVALTWHFPVMRTDVFVAGRSLLDGRSLDDGRASAPPALANYDVWLGGLFRVPGFGSRPRPPRAWPVVVLVCIGVCVGLPAWSPAPPEARLLGAAAFVVAGEVLLTAFVWSWLALSQRTHLALARRPDLGDTRRLLAWWVAFLGYPLAWLAAIAASLAVAVR
jgi:hypothetical protein